MTTDTRLPAEDAALLVYCPACKARGRDMAGPGEPCRTPAGKLAKTVHTARVDLASRCGLVLVSSR